MKCRHLLLLLVLGLGPLPHADAAPARRAAAAVAVPACIAAWQTEMQQDAAEFFTDMMDAEADADWQEQYRAYKQETQQAINNAVQAATKLYQARCDYLQAALALRKVNKKQLASANKLVESLLLRDIASYMQVSMFSSREAAEELQPTPRMPEALRALNQRPAEREMHYNWRHSVQSEIWNAMLDKVQEQLRRAYEPELESFTSWLFEPVSGCAWARNDLGELTPEALAQKEKLGKLFLAAEEAWLHHVRAQSELICPAGCFHGTILPTLQERLYLELLNSRDEYYAVLMGGIIQPEELWE